MPSVTLRNCPPSWFGPLPSFPILYRPSSPWHPRSLGVRTWAFVPFDITLILALCFAVHMALSPPRGVAFPEMPPIPAVPSSTSLNTVALAPPPPSRDSLRFFPEENSRGASRHRTHHIDKAPALNSNPATQSSIPPPRTHVWATWMTRNVDVVVFLPFPLRRFARLLRDRLRHATLEERSVSREAPIPNPKSSIVVKTSTCLRIDLWALRPIFLSSASDRAPTEHRWLAQFRFTVCCCHVRTNII